MNTKEHQAYIEQIRQYKAQLLKSDDEIRAFLVATGIYTKSGRLRKVYANVSVKEVSAGK